MQQKIVPGSYLIPPVDPRFIGPVGMEIGSLDELAEAEFGCLGFESETADTFGA